MKHRLLLLAGVTVGVLWAAPAVSAQDQTNSAATLARRDYEEERYKSLEAELRALQATYEAQQKRLMELSDALRQVREELEKRPANALTRDDLKPFEEKLKELNKNREADNKLIMEQLEKLLKAPPVVAPPPTPEPESSPAVKIPDKGYEYVVQSGDSLSTIIEAYKKAGVKVTMSLVTKANPTLKPERLKPGQKIFIPDPALK